MKPLNIIQEKWIEKFIDNFIDDAVIQCNEVKIPLNKNALAMMWPVFKRMFADDMCEKKSNIIAIEDFDEETIKRAIEFVMTGKDSLIEGMSYEEAKQLYLFVCW